MIRAASWQAGAAGLLLTTACAVVPEPPPVAPSREGGQPGTLLSRLAADEAAIRSVRGLASVRHESPSGGESGSLVIVVALPDRARLETLSPLGTTILALTIRGDTLQVHSPVRNEYGVGRATRETLGRLTRARVPPGPLLRLLAGLPPLPLRPADPRTQLAVEEAAIRVESVEGPLWQRLWAGPDAVAVTHGELGEATGPLLSFHFGERRWLGEIAFPFAVRIEEAAAGARLALRYETVRLNEPVEGGLFELPRPADGRTRILDLGGGSPP